MAGIRLKASKSPNEALALTNCAIVHPDDVPESVKYASIKGKTFTIKYARDDPALSFADRMMIGARR